MKTETLSEVQYMTDGSEGYVDITTGGVVSSAGKWRKIKEDWQEKPVRQLPQALAEECFGLFGEGNIKGAHARVQMWHELNPRLGGADTLMSEEVSYSDLTVMLDGSVRTELLKYWNMIPWPWENVVDIVSYKDYEAHKMQTLGDGMISHGASSGASTETRSDGLLPAVREGMPFPQMRIGEKYESIQITEYGGIISITERALRADDKGGFLEFPRKLATTARLTVSDSVANLFEQSSHAGPTLTEDSAAAFSTGRGNLGASALALAAVNTGVNAMAGFQSYNGASAGRVLGNIPRWLVVPSAYKTTADAIVGPLNSRLIGASGTTQSDYNPLSAILEVSTWPQLESTSWYLMTDFNLFPTARVAFLDGRREPIIESQGGLGPDLSDALGIKYRVRIPHGVGLVDWRGIYASSA